MSTSASIASDDIAPAGRRLLRVGIIQGNRLVEERLLPEGSSVTIGRSPRSTFILPSPDLPWCWRLFVYRRGRHLLRLAPGMSARVAIGGEITAFPARSRDDGEQPVVLPDGARGKVTADETAILFQLVRPPAPRPRAQLPSSVRQHVLAEVDRLFATVLALVVILHVVVVIYLRQVDWPRRPSLEEIPDRFVRQMLQRPRPAPAAVPAKDPVAAQESEPQPHPRAARPPRVPAPPAIRPRPTSRPDLEAQVRHLGLIPLIIAQGADGDSALRDLLSSGGVDRSVDEAMRGLGGVSVASADTLHGLHAGEGIGKTATVDELRGAGRIAAPARTGAVAERGVRSAVRVEPPSMEGGKVDPDMIARELRARRKGIAACYERALKERPTLGGKLVLRFTIARAGAVSAVSLDEDTLEAPDVASCVRALIGRLRFPPLEDGPVEVSFPFVFAPAS